jgi:hypothetical protein
MQRQPITCRRQQRQILEALCTNNAQRNLERQQSDYVAKLRFSKYLTAKCTRGLVMPELVFIPNEAWQMHEYGAMKILKLQNMCSLHGVKAEA